MKPDGWTDISADIYTANGRANPFGWSVREVHYKGQQIGTLYCGEPQDFKDGFSFEVKPEGNGTRLCVYMDPRVAPIYMTAEEVGEEA